MLFSTSNREVLRLHPLFETGDIGVQRALMTRERKPSWRRICNRGVADSSTSLLGRYNDSAERTWITGVSVDLSRTCANTAGGSGSFVDGGANSFRLIIRRTAWCSARKIHADGTSGYARWEVGDVRVVEEAPDRLRCRFGSVNHVDYGFCLRGKVEVGQNREAVDTVSNPAADVALTWYELC